MKEQITQAQQRIHELEKRVERLEKVNRSLTERAQRADSASRAKSDFLAMISHEIRTPMNGVIGISELLLHTELAPRQKHFAQLIHTSAGSLLTLINSLLDFSKIEADKMILDVEKFHLSALLTQLVTLYSVTGKRKGLFFETEFDPSLSSCYLGDAYRLRQILINLLGNAIKFTEKGGVVLRVSKRGGDNKGDLIRFEVKDSGLGIEKEKLNKLFQPFLQVDSSSTRRYSGTGLGLSICSKLVALMGGEFGVNSEPGQGSTFWFTLSLPPEEGEEHPVPLSELPLPLALETEKPDLDPLDVVESTKRLALLVVDDDETNRTVMDEIFRSTDALVVSACNGLEGLEKWRETSYDLIFMDCQMPVMDGFETTMKILEEVESKKGKPPVIVALTADATSSTKKRCKEVGMVDYLIKPLNFRALQDVLTKWLPDFNATIIPGSLKKSQSGAIAEDITDYMIINPDSLQRLREHVGNIEHVVRVFLDSLDTRLGDLEAAVASKNAESVKRVAHTLKGSCSHFGAEDLAHLCMLAENKGKSGNVQNIRPLLEKILRSAAKTKQFLLEHLD